MNYKYKKGQLFGKRLKVPKYILSNIYNCTLSLKEMLEYHLIDKIPTTCLFESDRQIVEKFGIEKIKNLDITLFTGDLYLQSSHFIELLKYEVDPSTDDINLSLYEIIKDQIEPSKYPDGMKKVYSNRLFSEEEEKNLPYQYIARNFNRGNTSLKDFIDQWDLYKEKDLGYCLKNDRNNVSHITSEQVKNFMDNFSDIAILIFKHSNLYQVISEVSNCKNPSEVAECMKKVTDQILSRTIEENSQSIILNQEEYRLLFQYSSIQDYLKKIYPSYEKDINRISKELETLPPDYIWNSPIPFKRFKDYNVIAFLSFYGLKNIVDFDNECGHFFTSNNCLMLGMMNTLYLHYSGNEPDPQKSIHTKKTYDENGNYIERGYTKEEFYEAMRRMIVYGPSNFDYMNKAIDYRNITGEFRLRNSTLFISEEAPLELQDKFYKKSITPKFLAEHREYLEYLKGKNLSSCLKPRQIPVEGSGNLLGYENLYEFLGRKMDFDHLMDFIIDYRDVYDIIFGNNLLSTSSYEVEFKIFKDDDIDQIRKKMNALFRKIMIEKEKIYPKFVPQSLLVDCPHLFLDSNAPKELQDAFYNRTVRSSKILKNPIYRRYLKDVDLELIYKYMPVFIVDDNKRYYSINLVNAIKQVFDSDTCFDFILEYGDYLDSIFRWNQLREFRLKSDFTKEDILNEMDSNLLKGIIDGKMKYNEDAPELFKNANPTLFLDSTLPLEIRQKFYNREFTTSDFEDSTLLDLFGNTNVVCGLPGNFSWIIPLFSNCEDSKKANMSRLKVVSAYSKISDSLFQETFREYVKKFQNSIDIDKLSYISTVLSRLSSSNSSEIFTFRQELATQILNSHDPIESLNKIEDVFIKNNIPIVGKVYSCFEILHPNLEGFDFAAPMMSPVLQNSSMMGRKTIIFSDLLKASFGSNNKSINSYLKNIEIGSKLYKDVKSGQIQLNMLDESQRGELTTFSKHLATLYNNTLHGKMNTEKFSLTGNEIEDISKLEKLFSPDGTLDYNLANRVVRMFCGLAGIDTLEQAKEYVRQKKDSANIRNRMSSNSEMKLEAGDFVKGIGDITYLRNILQNGSVSKEYLGSSAGSDSTPLDTDVSMIIKEEGTIQEKIEETASRKYGPIWFVLKRDDRFDITRTSTENSGEKKDMSKLEAFYTGVLGPDHYGIRTGFASSEINYILMDDYNPAVGLEICMNGFYIPVVDMKGKIVFTPDDYDKLREKMSGLTYFDEYDYKFSNNLMMGVPEMMLEEIEQSNYITRAKKKKINEVIQQSLNELSLELKTTIDGDLTEGFVELIDTGSTGRGTNKPGDGDFDFLMRLDKSLLSDPSKIENLKTTILRNLGKEATKEVTSAGDFRLKKVEIDEKTIVDIDITFAEKTDKVFYSTDVSLVDRLTNIQKNSPEKYPYIIANILLAKQVLKEAEVYKSGHSENPQGGLGGVGIENWILQNGGSFIDAAKNFVDASVGKNFSEFKKEYQIWDFGDNHLAEKRGRYPHDNFVSDNMTEAGYQKMVSVLREYLHSYGYAYEDEKSEITSVHR